MFNERKGVSRPADVREDRRALLERARRERDERQNAVAHASAAVAIQRAWRRFVARRKRRLATRAAFDADIRRAENGAFSLNTAAAGTFCLTLAFPFNVPTTTPFSFMCRILSWCSSLARTLSTRHPVFCRAHEWRRHSIAHCNWSH